jgi:ABC-2 type transport system ATP-binding protein
VWDTVRALRASGTTILLTTQYLDEAEQLADRVAILADGRVIADGTISELRALLPPAKVEYVVKQPSLEEVFLAITGGRAGAVVGAAAAAAPVAAVVPAAGLAAASPLREEEIR